VGLAASNSKASGLEKIHKIIAMALQKFLKRLP